MLSSLPHNIISMCFNHYCSFEHKMPEISYVPSPLGVFHQTQVQEHQNRNTTTKAASASQDTSNNNTSQAGDANTADAAAATVNTDAAAPSNAAADAAAPSAQADTNANASPALSPGKAAKIADNATPVPSLANSSKADVIQQGSGRGVVVGGVGRKRV